MRLVRFVLAIALTIAAPAWAADCPGGWKRTDEKSGVLGCERSVAGSSFREYLVLTTVRATPERAMQVLWEQLLAARFAGLKRREFLRKDPDKLVFYDQIHAAVVSDRDYTLEVDRRRNADGSVEIDLHIRNDLGPPPAPKHTRIPALRSRYVAAPSDGGTRLSVTTYSEPGGSVPAWIVRGEQARRAVSETLDLVRVIEGR